MNITRQIVLFLFFSGLFLWGVSCTPSTPNSEKTTDSSTTTEPASDAPTREQRSNGDAGSKPDFPQEVIPEKTTDTIAEKPAPESSPTSFQVQRIGRYIAGAHGLAVDDKGVIYIADTYGRLQAGVKAIYKLVPPYTGTPQKTSIPAVMPAGLLWYRGHLYVCDIQGNKVTRYNAALQSTKSWSATSPWNLSIHEKGQLFTVSYAGQVQELQEGGAPKTLFSGLQNPFDLHVLENGNIWVSEQGTSGTAPGRISLRSRTGTILKEIKHPWKNPEGLAVMSDGSVWIADTGSGEVMRIAADGTVRIVAGNLALPVNLHLFSNGDLLVATVGGQSGAAELYRISPKP